MSITRLSVLALLVACGETSDTPAPKTLEELAAEKCPRVGVDRLEGDYLFASGKPSTRFRVVKRGSETLLTYIDPTYSNHRIELVGTKNEKDWKFDERPRGKRKALIGEGGEEAKRIYLRPRLKECRWGALTGTVDSSGKETMPPKGKDFGEWPPMEGVVFSFAVFEEPLFLGKAATSKAVADAQVKELGGPKADVEHGSIPTGLWTDASADGAEDCTYTLDAYYDGQLQEDGKDVPAQPVVDGKRHWKHQFEVSFTDNHTFELHRYKTCGGKKELISVAGIDAILL